MSGDTQVSPTLARVLEDAARLQQRVPGKLILGWIGDIETGVRQMIRTVPLETTTLTLPSGHILTVPTDAEALRIKAWLIVRRNQTRDYLDVAALSDRIGIGPAAALLGRMDDYYHDQHGEGDGVASQLYRQLSDPRPRDGTTTRQLARYKNLDPRWHSWAAVIQVCHALADEMLEAG